MFQDPWPGQQSRLQVIALLVLLALLMGAVGYRYLTTATPLTAGEAVDMFHAEKGRAGSGADRRPDQDKDRSARARRGRARHQPDNRQPGRVRGSRIASAPPQQVERETRRGETRSSGSAQGTENSWRPGSPKEGVYTWDTEGYESFNGARRRFPAETHRIVTHKRGRHTWMNHHVFSKERETWIRVRATDDGYFTLWTRNRVVFGPVTRDSQFSFDPPMLTNPMTEVGDRWSGRWDGKTYGNYSGRIFDEGTMTIDGEKVEVIALELRMELHGEVEGTSIMQFWVSGAHQMVVREHYNQDVSSGAAEYHAEWDMTVQSLIPQR
jgi:hypothetical protein